MQRRQALAAAAMASLIGVTGCLTVSAVSGAKLFGLKAASKPAGASAPIGSLAPGGDQAVDAASDPAPDSTEAPVYVTVKQYFDQVVHLATANPAAAPSATGRKTPAAGATARPAAAASGQVAADVAAAPAAATNRAPAASDVAASAWTNDPAPSDQGTPASSSTDSGGDGRVRPPAVGTTVPDGIPTDSTIPRNWPVSKTLPPLPASPSSCAHWQLAPAGDWTCLPAAPSTSITSVRAAEHRHTSAPGTTRVTSGRSATTNRRGRSAAGSDSADD